jgi:phosphoribosylformylglycinamidine cyclo-ligase
MPEACRTGAQGDPFMSDRAGAYKAAGVDIDAAQSLVGRIKGIAAATFTKGVITDIGGFGGLFKPDLSNMTEPVLVSGTDGVGTKLKLAFDFDGHDTVGIDLVAMSVNDILVQGAKPLFFLDYFACGKLDQGIAERVIAGIAAGCKESGCALLGGETAEMPGFYAPGEYDLAGFCVGVVDNAKIVDGSAITIGDKIIGLASSGPHSNGYSLIRKIFAASGRSGEDILPGDGRTFREALLAPTRLYVAPILRLLKDLRIKGMAHITGGGFFENVPRVLPAGVTARLTFGSWTVPPVFHWLKEQGALSWPEMLQIFNCGIGYVLIVDKNEAEETMARLHGLELPAWVLGEAVRRKDGQEQVDFDFGA